MLSTVNFDDDHSRCASEVGKVGTDRMLTAKLDAIHPVSADQLPTDFLRPSAVSAKVACAFDFLVHSPSPRLSP
jgi:hypothetical protein